MRGYFYFEPFLVFRLAEVAQKIELSLLLSCFYLHIFITA
jgi:hypothetical protein